MIVKDIDMFYFDDKTFISLCKQVERETKGFLTYTQDNAHDLKLAYQKFELFLTVYHRSRKRDDIDYKTETRLEIASDINQMSEIGDAAEVTEEYHSGYFFNAKEKLERVIEDIIYQITMRNLALATESTINNDSNPDEY